MLCCLKIAYRNKYVKVLFYSMIHTSLSPNIESSDRRLAAFIFFFLQGRWKRGNAIETLGEELSIYLATDTKPFLLSSGRASFFVLLKALGITQDDEVLVQAFTCNAVINPILWQGSTPIYVDIDSTYNMSAEDLEKKITPKSKVVVLQHTFGTPADIDALMSIAKKHGLFVVEDCAHALGATYEGKKVGTFGDAAFFSFGRDKIISSVYGGALVVHNKQIRERVERDMSTYPYPTYGWIAQQIVHPLLFAPIVSLYWTGGRYALVALQKLHVLSKAVTDGEKQGKMSGVTPMHLPNALALLALHQLRKIEYLNDRRRYLAGFYAKHLGSIETRSGSIFLRYPLRHISRDTIMSMAKRNRILLGDWYNAPVAPKGTNLSIMKYIQGSCPEAERAAQEIYNLPTHINLTLREAGTIVSFLRDNDYTRNKQ